MFGYVTDPRKLSAWQTNTVSVVQEGEGPLTVGTRLREIHSTPGGKELESVVEVSEYELDRAFGLRVIEGTAVHGRLTFGPTKNGTLLRFRAYGQLTELTRLAQPLLHRILKRQFEKDCATLKQVLEYEPDP